VRVLVREQAQAVREAKDRGGGLPRASAWRTTFGFRFRYTQAIKKQRASNADVRIVWTMKISGPVVEVRVPTFNRPALLRRALQSLLVQTYSDWRAIILDDGNCDRTRAVLDDLRDRRLVHRPNEGRLGAARNIGQAFSDVSHVGGTHFAVLEDDNFWHREFLARNLGIMNAHDVRIIQSNQWIEEPEARDAPGKISSVTTLGDCHTEGRWRAEQFKVPLLWRLGISNSALFWRMDSRSDLRADDVLDVVLQEWVRAFRIVDDVYFLSEPLGVWRADGMESQRSAVGPHWRRFNGFLRREKAIQTMRRSVYKSIGRGNALSELLSNRFPTPIEIREEGVRRALLGWPANSRLSWRRRVELFAKASLLRFSP
jgi:glycosyltransferase involved in cell wall biosynthesis